LPPLFQGGKGERKRILSGVKTTNRVRDEKRRRRGLSQRVKGKKPLLGGGSNYTYPARKTWAKWGGRLGYLFLPRRGKNVRGGKSVWSSFGTRTSQKKRDIEKGCAEKGRTSRGAKGGLLKGPPSIRGTLLKNSS